MKGLSTGESKKDLEVLLDDYCEATGETGVQMS